MSELISFGAGVNSTAMTIMLVNRGWRGPIVFADTGTEWPETYCFMEYFESSWLKPRGLEITRLSAKWREKRCQLPLIDFCEHRALIPMPGFRWCTGDWKTDPLNRWGKAHGNPTQLVGMAADEAWRQKDRVCPLIERGIDRKTCIRIIQAERLEVPRKSGCYICMFQRVSQWRELWQQHPDLFERAARLEDACTKGRQARAHISIHGYTLRELECQFVAQIPMLDDHTLDALLEYKPCVCGL